MLILILLLLLLLFIRLFSADVLEGEIFLQNLPSIVTARVLGNYKFLKIIEKNS
jgi:hypothetical protein